MEPQKSNKNLMIGLALLAVVGIIVVIFFFMRPQSATAPTDGTSGTSETGSQNEVSDDTTMEESGDTMMEEDGAVKVFDLDASNFKYDVTEIRVQQGDTVTINLSASQGFHDWVVDELDAATSQINAGETTSVTFVADQAGTFEYYCSVGNHRQLGMVGTLIVE